MKRKPHRNPDKVYPDKDNLYVCGLGSEWRCPECGTVFLVRAQAWGYILSGRKYCSHKCLRAAEEKKKK